MKLKPDYAEQGDPIAGYEEHGPYHCEDCVHRRSKESDICIHPVVRIAPAMASRRVPGGVRVNLECGCCRFVKQPKEHDNDADDAKVPGLLRKVTKS